MVKSKGTTLIKHYWELSEEQKERARAAHRRWKASHDRRDYYKDYDKARQGKRLTYKMFDAAKRRAFNNHLPFDILEEDIIVPTNCPICSSKLEEAFGIRGGTRTSPTLDRKNNSEGYTKNNIAVICKSCNGQKGNATPEELRRIAEWMEK